MFIKSAIEVNGKPGWDQGTAFLVSLPVKRLRGGAQFGYLVTNRHVAQAINSSNRICRQYKILQTWLTWNLRASPTAHCEHTETEPNPPGLRWVFPEDPSVDPAALPLAPGPQKYDVLCVPLADFILPQLLSNGSGRDNGVAFGLGDKVIFAALFPPIEGTNEIQPILSQGVLSTLPDGPIPTTLCRPGSVYLADMH